MSKTKFWSHYVSYQTRVIVGFRKNRDVLGNVQEVPVKHKIVFRNGFYIPEDDHTYDRYLEQFFGGDRKKATTKIIDELMHHNAGPNGRRDFILMESGIEIRNKVEMNEEGKRIQDERMELMNEAKRWGIGKDRVDMSNNELAAAIGKAKQELVKEVGAIPEQQNVPVEPVKSVENLVRPVTKQLARSKKPKKKAKVLEMA